MRIPRVYTSQPLYLDTELQLNDNRSHYLRRVLRLVPQNAIVLFNGDGNSYPATIISIDKNTVRVKITSVVNQNPISPIPIHLAIGLSKGDRMDWIMQKVTELGVSEITPLFTQRSEVKLNSQRQEKKSQHWQQIIISACEQCGRNVLPTLHPVNHLKDWVNNCDAQLKLVLHHRSETKLSDITTKPESVALLIGPEGGLNTAEIAGAEFQQFTPLRLGQRVLRTETAPLAAISVLQYLWGDFA